MFYSIGRAIASLDGTNLLEEFQDVADRIQRSLLDVKIPVIERLEVGIRAAPARLVGGDYVDIIPRPDRRALFAIGDVSGKSLPSALRAMSLKYMIRGLVSVLDEDLASIVQRTNEVVCADVEPDAFVTLIVGTPSHDHRSLRFANAGHDPPIVYRTATGEIEEADIGGIAVGIDPAARYHEQTLDIATGDVVAFYTDGFTEARNPAGEQFTLAQVKLGLRDFHDLPAQAIADAMFEQIERHVQGTLNDDATILVLRVLDY
jgi:phosphoserine phosphatase RsbU/P